MSTYLPLPTYIITPTYINIPTYMSTYQHVPTHVNLPSSTYLYQSLTINIYSPSPQTQEMVVVVLFSKNILSWPKWKFDNILQIFSRFDKLYIEFKLYLIDLFGICGL